MKSDNNLTWFKLLFVNGLGNKGLSILRKSLELYNYPLEKIFELTESEFYQLIPEFGKGRFSRVRYENFISMDFDTINNSYLKLQENKVKILSIDNNLYPEKLKDTLVDNCPHVLFCKGYLPLLSTKSAAIIGSRNTDKKILKATEILASLLSNSGYNVVSGYAKGVDTAGHLGALKSDGTTSVVLSMGINKLVVNKEFQDLNWERNSLFISQFLPDENWRASNAMIRNKVVAGLSDVVIVINSGPEKDEKGKLSGTFDAAKTALNLNIPTFVLSPNIINADGNSELLNRGAIEFKKSEEIIEHLNKVYYPEISDKHLKIAEQTHLFG
ncbi:MAG: DNA-processing protein DprA [bacterium]